MSAIEMSPSLRLPSGSKPVLRDPDKIARLAEEQRDKAAKYVLSVAADAADAARLLDVLGINPADVGKRSKPTEAVDTSSRRGARRRRIR